MFATEVPFLHYRIGPFACWCAVPPCKIWHELRLCAAFTCALLWTDVETLHRQGSWQDTRIVLTPIQLSRQPGELGNDILGVVVQSRWVIIKQSSITMVTISEAVTGHGWDVYRPGLP